MLIIYCSEINTIKKDTILEVSRVVGLEVNAEKSIY